MKIGIIGAGPAGMSAALHAVWRGQQVTLFERNPMVGRKLLVTGSGRCNITNDGVTADKYICADTGWMGEVLSHFSVQDLLEMLRSIGVLTFKTADGWYYPLSESAQTVADAFFAALKSGGVIFQMNSQVTSIEKHGDGFTLHWTSEQSDQHEEFDQLVIAAGGAAYPQLGSRGELFTFLQKLGHTTLPKRPALAPVLLDLGALKALSGTRFDAGVRVLVGSKVIAESAGNLIVTDWGMNGPAVMDISHAVSGLESKASVLSVNFLHFHKTEFAGFLAEKRTSDLPVRNLLGAFFPPKVSAFFLKLARILESTPLHQIEENELTHLIQLMRDARFPVLGVRGFDFCQVSAGGVHVAEVNPLTMESKLIPGLFLVGETLDVVGPCGGYNLHHTFATGSLAGIALGVGHLTNE